MLCGSVIPVWPARVETRDDRRRHPPSSLTTLVRCRSCRWRAEFGIHCCVKPDECVEPGRSRHATRAAENKEPHMTARVTAALLMFVLSAIGVDSVGADAPTIDATPARISYLNGQVSFWRPGAEGWTPAVVNTPLAPGDALYTGPDGTVEIQVGPRAFVRAAVNTQVGIDNQDATYLQLRVTAGYAAVDLRGLSAGQAAEVGTPNAAFTIDRPGYYRVDVDPDSTAFAAYRNGSATLTVSNGNSTPIAPGQQAVITGTDQPQLAVGATPPLTAWDNWGAQRTDYMIQTASQ